MGYILILKKEGDPLNTYGIWRRKSLEGVLQAVRRATSRRKYVKWTAEHDAFIRENYHRMTTRQIAAKLSTSAGPITRNSVISRARKLGLSRSTR